MLLLFPSSLTVAFAEQNSSGSLGVSIYGATPAGIAAAVAAAKDNQRVVLIEPTSRIGGLVTNGLSHSGFHTLESLRGAFLDFSRAVETHYATQFGPQSPQVKDSFHGTHGEPKVNLLVFEEMLAQYPTIQILRRTKLVDVNVLQNEGDLMAAARCEYRVGREASIEYDESLDPETPDNQLQAYNNGLPTPINWDSTWRRSAHPPTS